MAGAVGGLRIPALVPALLAPLAVAALALPGAARSQEAEEPLPAGASPPLEEVLAQDPLATTDAMARFVAERVPPSFKPSDRLSTLLDALFSDEGLGVEYGDRETRSARDTFEMRSGNCISFTHLLVALAREAGLHAAFVEVDEVVGRDLRGEAVVANKHMLVAVEIENGVYPVDLVPGTEDDYRHPRRISDRRAAAHFFNNLGVERLLAGEAETSLAFFRRASELAPEFADPWINRGVALRRLERLGDAEAAYRRALELDPGELSAVSNLAYLYDLLGRAEEGAVLHRRVAGYRKRNPFHALGEGRRALAAGDLAAAVEHFQEAVRRGPEEARLHFALGDALYRAGDLERAEASLRRAVRLAEDEQRRQHYTAALEAVTLLRARPPTGL